MRYQLLKNGVPVAMAYSAEECDRLYLEYDCDEVRGIRTDDNGEVESTILGYRWGSQ